MSRTDSMLRWMTRTIGYCLTAFAASAVAVAAGTDAILNVPSGSGLLGYSHMTGDRP